MEKVFLKHVRVAQCRTNMLSPKVTHPPKDRTCKEEKQFLISQETTSNKYNAIEGSKPFDTPSNADWIAPLVLTIISLVTRLYDIGKSNFVVWDEVIKFNFESIYIEGSFRKVCFLLSKKRVLL